MCYEQYTIRNIIRTRGVIREGFKREALIPFHVIHDQLQVIIENVYGIDEGFDHVPAEEYLA